VKYTGLSAGGGLNFSHWDLPFDVAQGGELVEPFVICHLKFDSFVKSLNFLINVIPAKAGIQ
jgi:hypothetical protein